MGRTVGEFLERFAVPLVRGGPAHVGRAITRAELETFVAELDGASVAVTAVDEARGSAVGELVVRPPPFVVDEDDVRLAAALHNLLFLEHPATAGWAMPRGRLARVRGVAWEFVGLPPARDRYRLLARHAMLHNVFRVRRRDVELSWWTGSATYQGQQPPARLRRWRTVRRVRERVSEATYADLLGDPDVEPIVGKLLGLSPLTDLLSQPREGPPMAWDSAVTVVRDAELARAVAYRAVGDASAGAIGGVPVRYAAAFERFVERRPPAPDVRAVASFLVHLNALLAVAESAARDVDAPSPALAALLAPERAAQRPRGLVTLLGLPDAVATVDRTLAVPPGIDADDAVARRWRCHRAQVGEAIPRSVRERLADRLRAVWR